MSNRTYDFEKFAAEMLKGTTTGFTRHPNSRSYNGFTCPQCGRHEFGTSTFPNGVKVGSCHGSMYHPSENNCTFTWNRNVKADEENAIYDMSRDEWMAAFRTEAEDEAQ